MAKASSAAPNPFASAKRKPAASAKRDDAPIIVAQDMTAYNGGKFTRAEVVNAIEGVVKAKELEDQATALSSTCRPTVLACSRTAFASQWLMQGARPRNPKFVADANGAGAMLSIVFMDSSNKLDNNSYESLANLIGAENAEQYTTQRDDFVINPELLEQEVDVKVDGKVTKMRVMDAMAYALQSVFAPSPAVAENIFQIVPKFATNKGLIDKGLELVAPDKTPASAMKLAQFLEIGRFTTQVKVGSSGA